MAAATMTAEHRLFLRAPTTEDLHRVMCWMQQPAVYRWFDFGHGRQQLSAIALHVMAHSPQYRMRMFGDVAESLPVGLVVLADVQHPFGTASFWVVREPGHRAYPGITSDAACALLQDGFSSLERRSINAWAVECNERSLRLLHTVGFRTYGIQRACHCLDGRLLGRVHLQLLPEHFCGRPTYTPC